MVGEPWAVRQWGRRQFRDKPAADASQLTNRQGCMRANGVAVRLQSRLVPAPGKQRLASRSRPRGRARLQSYSRDPGTMVSLTRLSPLWTTMLVFLPILRASMALV